MKTLVSAFDVSRSNHHSLDVVSKSLQRVDRSMNARSPVIILVHGLGDDRYVPYVRVSTLLSLRAQTHTHTQIILQVHTAYVSRVPSKRLESCSVVLLEM